MIIINKHRTAIFNFDKFVYLSKMDDPNASPHHRYQIIGCYENEDYVIIDAFDNKKERDETFEIIITYLAQEERIVRL